MSGSEGKYEVKPATPRQTVRARFGPGQIYEAPPGTPLEAFVRAAYPEESTSIVAALVDGKLLELTFQVDHDVDVMPLSIATSDGLRIYQRSISFLLVVAARELFPEARVIVDHALPSGFFCQIQGREPLTAGEVAALEKRMREIVAKDAPIVKQKVPLAEAIEVFRRQGYDDKVRLLSYRQKDHLTIYTLRGVEDYFYGHMVPSTRYLHQFGLRHYPPGFIVRIPRSRPSVAPSLPQDSPKLAAVFRQHNEWMKLMGVEDVGGLNQAIENDRIREVILVAEAFHERCIGEIAQEIARRRNEIRLVLVAGPSSSGKTTFLKRLSVQLLANGIRPLTISLDDYFVDREKTPRDEHGEYDFEALETVDLALFNDHLLKLMAGEWIVLPRYNFETGRRETGRRVALQEDQIILAEGIHGLNPALVPGIPLERIYRIYVSALTQLNIDHHNRIPTADTRLLRRIIRDAASRGYSAKDTIKRWESVVRGEMLYIFPYQENADVMFNSALVYELAVLKPFAEPLLRQVEPGTMEYVEVKRLLAFLQWFLPCPPDLVPDNSILREFIGGSILRDLGPYVSMVEPGY
jgi:uridine kinase